MKISIISDTHHKHIHLQLPSENEIDTIIHAGDFSSFSKSFNAFLEWYSSLPYKNKILVAGNHDEYVFETGYETIYEICKKVGIIYLQDSSVEIDNIVFHGSPWSNCFGLWAFMEEENVLESYWNKIPLQTNVLITHGPAYGKGDRVNNDLQKERHVGSKTLLKRLEALKKLKLHCYGHIHEAFGEHNEKNQTFISYNACSFDDNKTMLNVPLIFEIKKEKI